MAQADDLDIPLEIAFHGMDTSEHLEHQVRRQAKKLERFRNEIVDGRIVVEADHKGSQSTQLQVKVELSVPGSQIVGQAEGRPHESQQRSDIYGVIREAVETAERRLQTYVGKHFHPQKTPGGSARRRATIRWVDQEKGHGLLETDAGQSLFFQSPAVKGEGIESLEAGMEVDYTVAEAQGAYGPEAETVQRVVGGRT